MNAVVVMTESNVVQNEITMTSLQIVEYINDERQRVADAGGKRYVELLHKSFLAKVPQVLAGEMSAKYFAHIDVPGPNGGVRQSPAYILPKREASLMAMSYSYTIQAQVWDHMTRLEEELTKQTGSNLINIPTTMVEALRLAADNMEKAERVTALLEVAEAQVAIAAPAVAFVEKYRDDASTFTFRQIARLLDANEREFREFLVDAGIMYKLNSDWMAYKQHITAGRFVVKITEFNSSIQYDTKFTTKGFDYVQGMWNTYGLC